VDNPVDKSLNLEGRLLKVFRCQWELLADSRDLTKWVVDKVREGGGRLGSGPERLKSYRIRS